jgi:hypothetical protein
MALDDRVVAAAPSCYITSLERLFETIGPQDAEQNIPGQVAFGMEHADYLTLRAPRPTLVCVATRDFFDIDGAWTSFREASVLYSLLGHGERISMFEYPDKHGFSRPRREAAMRWMRRWLLDKDDAPVEGAFPIFKDRELQCTRSGQVLEDLHGKSVVHFNALEARQLARQRARLADKQSPDELRQKIMHLLGVLENCQIEGRSLGDAEARPGYKVQRVIYETDRGIFVPGLAYSPEKGTKEAPWIIYLDGSGMALAAGAGGLVEKLVLSGKMVLALDLRGMGETAPGGRRDDFVKHFGADWREAFLGMALGRPLLGQRVRDLLSVVGELRGKVQVIASGSAGPIALHAAALDARIRSVVVEKSIISWSAVAAAPVNRNQLTNVVHGALKVYDLPELAGLIAPRPLTIRAGINPVLNAVTQKELEEAYAPCRAAYERLKVSKQLKLQAGAE